MKGLLIASVVLLALVSVSASEVEAVNLRGPENRNLGLLGINLNLNVLDLIKLCLQVNIADPVSCQQCLENLNLLKIKLTLQLTILGGCSVPVPDCNPNLSIDELLKLCAAVNLNDPLSCAFVLKCIAVLKIKLAALCRRNLGLLDLNLNLNLLDLLKLCLKVNVGDQASIKKCLKALKLLKIKLQLQLTLLGGCSVPVPDCNPNLSIKELLKLCAAVNLHDPLSCAFVLKCIAVLKIKLTALCHRNLNSGGGIVCLNLEAEVASLVNAIVKVDVNNLVSVKLCLSLIQLLEADLAICLPVSININDLPADIDVNATIVDLLNIIGKCDLKNSITVIAAINACGLLNAKLLAIVG